MTKITIARKTVKGALTIEKMEHELGNMQALVGGYIELVRFPHNIDCWINEEGKLIGSLPNIALIKSKGMYGWEVLDWLVGDLFFASHDDEGNTVGLKDYQIRFLTNAIIPCGIGMDEDDLPYPVYGFNYGRYNK